VIQKDEFVAGMAALGGAFGREVEAPVQRMYYAVLNPRLTTEQFQEAVSRVVATQTFWPSPAVLLNAVKADDESRALLAFEHVNRITGQSGGYRFLTAETYHREFDAPTRQAISAVGGLVTIANTSEDRWSGLQRRFSEAYQTALRPALAVPADGPDPRARRLIAETADKLEKLGGRDRALGRDR